MKNKWLIIIISLALGIALIGVGFMLKWQEGYKLDTDEQVKSAIADLNGISSKEVKLLGTTLYQKEDCQYYLAIGKANLESFVYIFEEKLNHRFAKYYVYTGANFEQNCLTLRDATKGLFFVVVRNTYHHIAEIQPIVNSGDMKSEYISDDKEYIIKGFDNTNNRILTVSLLTAQGESYEDSNYEEISIDQGR